MNIVKNSGSSFVEAEYVVTSELTDTLVLKMQIYSGDTLLSEDTKDFCAVRQYCKNEERY